MTRCDSCHWEGAKVKCSGCPRIFHSLCVPKCWATCLGQRALCPECQETSRQASASRRRQLERRRIEVARKKLELRRQLLQLIAATEMNGGQLRPDLDNKVATPQIAEEKQLSELFTESDEGKSLDCSKGNVERLYQSATLLGDTLSTSGLGVCVRDPIGIALENERGNSELSGESSEENQRPVGKCLMKCEKECATQGDQEDQIQVEECNLRNHSRSKGIIDRLYQSTTLLGNTESTSYLGGCVRDPIVITFINERKILPTPVIENSVFGEYNTEEDVRNIDPPDRGRNKFASNFEFNYEEMANVELMNSVSVLFPSHFFLVRVALIVGTKNSYLERSISSWEVQVGRGFVLVFEKLLRLTEFLRITKCMLNKSNQNGLHFVREAEERVIGALLQKRRLLGMSCLVTVKYIEAKIRLSFVSKLDWGADNSTRQSAVIQDALDPPSEVIPPGVCRSTSSSEKLIAAANSTPNLQTCIGSNLKLPYSNIEYSEVKSLLEFYLEINRKLEDKVSEFWRRLIRICLTIRYAKAQRHREDNDTTTVFYISTIKNSGVAFRGMDKLPFLA